MTVSRSRGLAAPIVVVKTGLKCHKPPGRPVDVAERFRSIAWAEASTGIGRTQIVAQLSGRIKHARGVVFAYVALVSPEAHDCERSCSNCIYEFLGESIPSCAMDMTHGTRCRFHTTGTESDSRIGEGQKKK